MAAGSRCGCRRLAPPRAWLAAPGARLVGLKGRLIGATGAPLHALRGSADDQSTGRLTGVGRRLAVDGARLADLS